jgi:hypothetical protein
MPTLRGLAVAITGAESRALLIGLSIVVVLALIWIACRSTLEYGLAFALLGGLLIGYHAYVQDCMILLMTFVLVLQHSRWPPVRAAVALAITPPIYLCLMAGKPWNGIAPLVLLICLMLAALGTAQRRSGESRQAASV